MQPNLPVVKLNQGIHVMHLFYRVDRAVWSRLGPGQSESVRTRLETLCQANANASHPRISVFATVGGKADIAFMLFAAELGALGQMHRDIEHAFPPGALQTVYSYLSVTELSEYMSTEEDHRKQLEREKIVPESPEFMTKMEEFRKRMTEYSHYRLYPELPDWEVMCFYPMNKRRSGSDNWYSLDLATRRQLMGGHARVGRKYAGRVTQLITGSTGVDDWEWGVTLVAQQIDPIKEIVYEMRFDEVSAKYGEFGEFYMNLRLAPAALWAHLHL
ncbi:MAG: heme-dependent peroxidase [Verrucomicrobia bacterium]|nr:heme-dependent peroxidase [Verrucomicrobiota bacterium]MBI3870901.1 heme-dependent peroxidase [Verrucomicrobiota bacterium]